VLGFLPSVTLVESAASFTIFYDIADLAVAVRKKKSHSFEVHLCRPFVYKFLSGFAAFFLVLLYLFVLSFFLVSFFFI
jgi:hypothetical protein